MFLVTQEQCWRCKPGELSQAVTVHGLLSPCCPVSPFSCRSLLPNCSRFLSTGHHLSFLIPAFLVVTSVPVQGLEALSLGLRLVVEITLHTEKSHQLWTAISLESLFLSSAPLLRNNRISAHLLRNYRILCGLMGYLTSFGGFPGGSEVKASACNAGDLGLIPGLGRSPGEGNDNLLQYSCLENPMDRGALWATVHGVAKSQTRLSDFTFTFCFLYFDCSSIMSENGQA